MKLPKQSISDKAMFALKVTPQEPPASSAGAVRVKTGPGALVAHLAAESEVLRENDALKAELKTWEGASPNLRLHPDSIVPSRWANRHRDSFTSEEFSQLKSEIQSAGGNIQPIKVRPVQVNGEQKYEIVFGHRRHRACLELGLTVLAFVESITDQTLFQEMDRENRNRADLRPYEQGDMYRRALDEGLFVSLRALAEAIGATPGNVSTALQIARLPVALLDAFPSRLDIQYRWAKPLSDLVVGQPDLVLSRAKEIVDRRKTAALSAQEVFTLLTLAPGPKTSSEPRQVKAGGVVVASIRNSSGRVIVEFEKDALTLDRVKHLEKAIAGLFA